MPLVPIELTPDDVNGAWRGAWGQALTGADKRDLAERFGVSVRTVQRWTTTAGEQRNPLPSKLADVPEDEWPATYQDRAEATRRMTEGGQNEETETGQAAEFGRVTANLPEAERWARALEQEELDPWLTEAWREYRIVRTERGWEVRVGYDTTVSP